MKKLILPFHTEIDRSGWRSLIMEVTSNNYLDFCLELILLNEGLISNLVVENLEQNLLQIEILPKTHFSKLIQTKSSMTLKIAKNALEYWISFFLKIYRDHISEVDHIDIEYNPENSNKSIGYVTIQVENNLYKYSFLKTRQ